MPIVQRYAHVVGVSAVVRIEPQAVHARPFRTGRRYIDGTH